VNKKNKIIACIQILIIIYLALCNSVTAAKFSKKSSASNYKGNQCCCKSESDCKSCCCAINQKNNDKSFQNDGKWQKDKYHIFINSVNCKSGNDPLTNITITVKYTFERPIQPAKETFLCFLINNISIYHPEIIATPPEKPPRHFA